MYGSYRSWCEWVFRHLSPRRLRQVFQSLQIFAHTYHECVSPQRQAVYQGHCSEVSVLFHAYAKHQVTDRVLH